MGIEPSYIFRVSGIRSRFWADSQEECSFLAEQATRRALDQAGLVPEDLDAILVSSTSPEMIFPSTACLLQARLGIRGIPAFDLSASCSGFLYGLSMADCFIRAGQFRRCLVVASEIKSRSLDVKDLSTTILFGDGAGAAIVERSSNSDMGVVSIRLHADGTYHDLVKIAGGGSRQPLSQDVLDASAHTLRIRGSRVFRIAIRRSWSRARMSRRRSMPAARSISRKPRSRSAPRPARCSARPRSCYGGRMPRRFASSAGVPLRITVSRFWRRARATPPCDDPISALKLVAEAISSQRNGKRR